MIQVGLIVSSWFYFNRPMDHQPLTQLYLATLIDAEFVNGETAVQLIDLRGLDSTSAIEQIPPMDIYLYTVTSPDYAEIKGIVNCLRRKYPGSVHVAGGIHVNIFPKTCAEVFDSIVLGAGERSLIELIRDCRKNSVKNFYDMQTGIYSKEHPYPLRHYMPKSAIVNRNFFKTSNLLSTSAQFGRGCPFKCSFCANIHPSKIRLKTPQKIAEEIAYLKREFNIEGISLKDDVCIPLNKKQAVPYLEALGQADIKWRGQTRIETPFELIKLARESGCLELALGVESASQRVLDIVNKGLNIDEIVTAIEHLKKNDIKVQVCMIIGLPGEPRNIVSITRSFIERIHPNIVMLAGFCPYPGTPIFNDPEYYGIKWIDPDYSRHAHLIHRFKNDEDDSQMGLPFEYHPENRWGKTFSRDEILNNLIELQFFLQERGLIR